MNPKLPTITSKQLIRALKRGGFLKHHQTGSHIIFRHVDFAAIRIVVPSHTKDIKKGTLKGILKDAGMTVKDLIDLL